MGRVAGKVALITGAARGQGRAHAVRLAEEGADIVAIDVCRDVETVSYAGATEGDLAETVKLVQRFDRRVLAAVADVRDLAALNATVAQAIDAFGGIDIVIANAGIGSIGPVLDIEEHSWQTVLDVNLTGVWKTVKAVAPTMIEHGRGGSIILVSSVAGLMAYPNMAHYVAAKHGITGLMRSLAVELAPHSIRVNSVHPITVDTPMVNNPESRSLFTGRDGCTFEEFAATMSPLQAFDIPWVQCGDVSHAVVFLASDESRYVTGTTGVIDAGAMLPHKIPHPSSSAS
jgi:SDR family mycofactocin-dependent oxidoreductase